MCSVISCIKGIQEQGAEGIFEPKRETLTGYTMRDFIIYTPCHTSLELSVIREDEVGGAF
jgi:hypothetical protein